MKAAIAASLENTALLPTAEKPAERELTAVERNLRPPPSPGVEKRAAVAEAEDRLSDTLAKMALAPSNARAPAVLEVGTPVSFKLSDGSVRRGVVEKVHNDGAAYTLVEDGTGVRWQHHPARSLKARKTPKVAPPQPPAADVDAVLSFLTPAQRQRFVDNEVTLECLALLNDEDLEDLLEGDAEAKASFRLRYPPPATDEARADPLRRIRRRISAAGATRAAHAPAAGGAAADENPGAAAPARGRRREYCSRRGRPQPGVLVAGLRRGADHPAPARGQGARRSQGLL